MIRSLTCILFTTLLLACSSDKDGSEDGAEAGSATGAISILDETGTPYEETFTDLHVIAYADTWPDLCHEIHISNYWDATCDWDGNIPGDYPESGSFVELRLVWCEEDLPSGWGDLYYEEAAEDSTAAGATIGWESSEYELTGIDWSGIAALSAGDPVQGTLRTQGTYTGAFGDYNVTYDVDVTFDTTFCGEL